MPTALRSQSLTPAAVQAAYDALDAELAGLAPEPGACLAFFERWNALKCQASEEGVSRRFRAAQDTRDVAAQDALKALREALEPELERRDAAIRTVLLTSPFRGELEARYGPLLFTYFALQQETFAPENLPREVSCGEARARYDALMGGAAIPVAGQPLTLAAATALFHHPDTALREEAWRATGEWLLGMADEVHALFGRLVAERHAQARQLGFPDFVPLAYRRLRRTDYGPDEARLFRDGIKRHVVPALARLRRWQAQSLYGGRSPVVRPWDAQYFPALSLPPEVAPVDGQLEAAQRVFDALHPRLGGHFRRMRAEGLIDLENRPGKRPGAFCSTLDASRLVAIFCNSTGAAEDVRTLLHEMGHAFMGWEAAWIDPLELRWPTFDACEVHSMGMEYLALPHIEAFFAPEHAVRYRKLQLVRVLVDLPYMALVDEFQHWVYAHPEATPEARDEAWIAFRAGYLVGEEIEGFEALHATRWKRQQHPFHWPFYYLDYAIALSGALQLWLRDRVDHDGALSTYLTLCQLGGSQSLSGLWEAAGLLSPFDPDLFAPLVDVITRELEI